MGFASVLFWRRFVCCLCRVPVLQRPSLLSACFQVCLVFVNSSFSFLFSLTLFLLFIFFPFSLSCLTPRFPSIVQTRSFVSVVPKLHNDSKTKSVRFYSSGSGKSLSHLDPFSFMHLSLHQSFFSNCNIHFISYSYFFLPVTFADFELKTPSMGDSIRNGTIVNWLRGICPISLSLSISVSLSPSSIQSIHE